MLGDTGSLHARDAMQQFLQCQTPRCQLQMMRHRTACHETAHPDVQGFAVQSSDAKRDSCLNTLLILSV